MPPETYPTPTSAPAPATAPEIDWRKKAEHLAADNLRLRSGIAGIINRAQSLPHVVMPNGEPLTNYCRGLLTTSTPE